MSHPSYHQNTQGNFIFTHRLSNLHDFFPLEFELNLVYLQYSISPTIYSSAKFVQELKIENSNVYRVFFVLISRWVRSLTSRLSSTNENKLSNFKPDTMKNGVCNYTLPKLRYFENKQTKYRSFTFCTVFYSSKFVKFSYKLRTLKELLI